MIIEIKYRAPLYKAPDKSGKQKILKKSILYVETIDTEDIKSVGPYYKENGEIHLKKCRINHENLGPIIIEHSYEEMRNFKINKRMIVKGFNYGKSGRK